MARLPAKRKAFGICRTRAEFLTNLRAEIPERPKSPHPAPRHLVTTGAPRGRTSFESSRARRAEATTVRQYAISAIQRLARFVGSSCLVWRVVRCKREPRRAHALLDRSQILSGSNAAQPRRQPRELLQDLEALTNQSLRAYELGRLRMATKVALLVLPIIAICMLEPIGRETCACCGALLLAAATWLRFRDRAGVNSVSTGLLAGGIPLTAALALTQLDPGCASAGPLSYCTAFSVLLGGAAGAIVALREATARTSSGHWLLAASIAALAASLGCARLGVASVAGVAFGIIVGRAAMKLAQKTA